MNQPKVQIYKHFKAAPGHDKDDEWGWRLIATNGEQVAQGEGHGSPRDAERAFRGVCAVVLEIVSRLWGYADPANHVPVEIIHDPSQVAVGDNNVQISGDVGGTVVVDGIPKRQRPTGPGRRV